MTKTPPSGGSFGGIKDAFDGVTISPHDYGDASPDEFYQRLEHSLDIWTKAGNRGIWLEIPASRSILIPMAAELGFEFHHTQENSLVLTKWLPTDKPNHLPTFATHTLGSTGLVINGRNEVLLVQNRSTLGIWKCPSGAVHLGEHVGEAAIRVTLEETGVKTEFIAVVMFRHTHDYCFGAGDIHFACLLQPLSTDITIDTTEIAAAKWISLDKYLADPNTSPLDRAMVEAYNEGVRQGCFICPQHHPRDKTQLIYSPLNLIKN